MGWTATEVMEATAARASVAPTRFFPTVSTDSRRIEADALFIALTGERHDGHNFVADVLQRGAAAALVARVPAGVDPARTLIVADTQRALGDLAAWTRRRRPLQVAAITGSNGKTTTKEMLASICGSALPAPSKVLKTLANENNLIGLPLTLLRLADDDAIAVLEMGMNVPGEIARMTEIADPDVGVVTNVAPAHLEGLGSIAGVAKAKQELYASMDARGTIAVNIDDEWVARIATVFRGRRIEFGTDAEVHARNQREATFDGITFDLTVAERTTTVRLHIPGQQAVRNALAAAAVAHGLGIGLDAIRAGLEAAVTPHMRMEVTRLDNGTTVVNDAYNANPGSMEAAIRLIAQHPGRSIAALGEMRELGELSEEMHQRVGTIAAEAGVDILVAVGPHADAMARGARAGGMNTTAIFVCAEPEEAARVVTGLWRAGDAIVVKGSRGSADDPLVRAHGARMAMIVDQLIAAGSKS